MALKKKKLKINIKKITEVINSKGFIYSASFLAIAILYVGFRMKAVEQTYKLNKISQNYEKVNHRNKELKGLRADASSVKKLRAFAEKYNLKEPGPEQIIFIP